jgi:D-alanyl-D-alanine carboxypeptidase
MAVDTTFGAMPLLAVRSLHDKADRTEHIIASQTSSLDGPTRRGTVERGSAAPTRRSLREASRSSGDHAQVSSGVDPGRTGTRGTTGPARTGRGLGRLGRDSVRAVLMLALVISITGTAYRVGAAPAAAQPQVLGTISTVDALTLQTEFTPPPALMSPSAGPSVVERASRSVERSAVPGCDGNVTGKGTNGRLPPSELCDLWHAPYKARADAAVTLIALNDSYFARFGTDICLSSGYRTFEQQLALRAAKGAIAASAGQSNHGWGLAVDLCPAAYAGARGAWLHEVGPAYGWANPPWAHRGGGGSYEPWHWEYAPGVAALTAAGGADS